MKNKIIKVMKETYLTFISNGCSMQNTGQNHKRAYKTFDTVAKSEHFETEAN
jgi:hypothetical protein